MHKRILVPVAVLVAGIVAAGLIIGDTVIQLQRDRQAFVAATETRMQSVAKAVEEHVERTIAGIDVSLLYMRDIWQHDRPHFAAVAAQVQKSAVPGLIMNMSVSDAEGAILWSTVEPDAPTINVKDREYFRFHQESAADVVYISKPVPGRAVQRPILSVSRRFVDPAGRLQGVILVVISPDDLVRIYDHLDIGPHGVIGVIGTDRYLRTRQSRSPLPPEVLAPQAPATRPYFQPDAPAAGVTRLVDTRDQVVRMSAFRRLPNYPLIVTVSEAESDIFAKVNEREHGLILFSASEAGAILIFTGLLAWLLRRLYRNQAALLVAKAVADASEERYRSVVTAMTEGVILRDRRGRIVMANDAALHILRTDRQTIETQASADPRWHIIRADGTPFPADEHPAMVTLRTGLAQSNVELGLVRSDQETTWLAVNTQPLFEQGGSGGPYAALSTFADVTERRRLEERLRRMALYDPLTNLPNRALFHDHLVRQSTIADRRGEALALLYIDLDGFKPVNDRAGPRSRRCVAGGGGGTIAALSSGRRPVGPPGRRRIRHVAQPHPGGPQG